MWCGVLVFARRCLPRMICCIFSKNPPIRNISYRCLLFFVELWKTPWISPVCPWFCSFEPLLYQSKVLILLGQVMLFLDLPSFAGWGSSHNLVAFGEVNSLGGSSGARLDFLDPMGDPQVFGWTRGGDESLGLGLSPWTLVPSSRQRPGGCLVKTGLLQPVLCDVGVGGVGAQPRAERPALSSDIPRDWLLKGAAENRSKCWSASRPRHVELRCLGSGLAHRGGEAQSSSEGFPYSHGWLGSSICEGVAVLRSHLRPVKTGQKAV